MSNNLYKLTINTKESTNIIGAVINSNSDQLELNTNNLITKDLKDFYYQNQEGFGLSTGIGSNTDKGETNIAPNGSTTLTLKDTGSEREQITKTTIGNGNVVVGGVVDSLIGVNRDLDNTQVIFKDEITGVLDGNLTIDNRIFTSAGRESIGSDLKYTKEFGVGLTKASNVNRITYYGKRAFGEDDYNIENNNNKYKNSHEKSAEAYGNYVGNPLAGGIVRTFGEVGQFFYYSADDLVKRIVPGGEKKGNYQPYCWDCPGGLRDSGGDISNVFNGAKGNYKYQPNQEAVDKYNNEDYKIYQNNNKKWVAGDENK